MGAGCQRWWISGDDPVRQLPNLTIRHDAWLVASVVEEPMTQGFHLDLDDLLTKEPLTRGALADLFQAIPAWCEIMGWHKRPPEESPWGFP